MELSRERVREGYGSLEAFLTRWQAADRKRALLEEIEQGGFLLEELQAQVQDREFDPFDLICYVAYDQPVLSRRERARCTRESALLDQYSQGARRILEALLDK